MSCYLFFKDQHGDDTRTDLLIGPSRIKRLSTDNNDSADLGYRITGYHHLGSDSKK
jgi:hypothetical protein